MKKCKNCSYYIKNIGESKKECFSKKKLATIPSERYFPSEDSSCDDFLESKIDHCKNTFELANGYVTSPCHLEINHIGDCRGYILGSECSWDKRFSSEEEQYMHNQRIDNFAINILEERLEYLKTQIIIADTLPHIKEELGIEYDDYKSFVKVLERSIKILKEKT